MHRRRLFDLVDAEVDRVNEAQPVFCVCEELNAMLTKKLFTVNFMCYALCNFEKMCLFARIL